MAAFYADQNFPIPAVEILRRAGHDVLKALEAGQANQRIPDEKVLEFATRLGRCVLTQDRWHFTRLHGSHRHAGIVACTQDGDDGRLAAAIDAAVRRTEAIGGTIAGTASRSREPSRRQRLLSPRSALGPGAGHRRVARSPGHALAPVAPQACGSSLRSAAAFGPSSVAVGAWLKARTEPIHARTSAGDGATA